jgi:SAM-dependent methyltransferase
MLGDARAYAQRSTTRSRRRWSGAEPVDELELPVAEHARALLARGARHAAGFRAALLSVPPLERDAWLDCVLGLGELPDDGPELPRGCVPYVPCPVDTLLKTVEHAPVRASDVFVDVGAGQGRTAVLVHLLTGASVIGVEIQPALVRAARDLVSRLGLARISCIAGDATTLAGCMTIGSVFFLYCPFGGDRLAKLVAGLEPIARTRALRICCVALRLPPQPWLTLEPPRSAELAIYRSTLHEAALRRRTG